MRRILLVLAIIVLALIGITEYKAYTDRQKARMTTYKTPFVIQGLFRGQEYKVETVRVQKGHEFEIKIYDVGWIKGYLSKKTPVLSQKPVIELFNSATNPRVVLLEELDNAWAVDIKLTVDGQEIDLMTWLGEQGLLFN
tara:strand:- start:37038 stop:37454 length:417 start_codon:yes stop_codon:yes gene_type:complete